MNNGNHRISLQLAPQDDEGPAVVAFEGKAMGEEWPFPVRVLLDEETWRQLGEPVELVLRVRPDDVVALTGSRLLPSGWWYCVCEKSEGAGGVPYRLNSPHVGQCGECRMTKPVK